MHMKAVLYSLRTLNLLHTIQLIDFQRADNIVSGLKAFISALYEGPS